MLSEQQKQAFWRDGYLMVGGVVAGDALARLQRTMAGWVDESRAHAQPWGRTIDDRPRFHLEAGHGPGAPRLLRVNAPIEVSDDFLNVATDGRLPAVVADLIGPNVKLHHTKINAKQPGGHTAVRWHQDFAFTPHSNDDVVTALVMVDEVDERNGPLEVLPGSHRDEIYSLWHDEAFTGAVSTEIESRSRERAVLCTGPAGSVCLMHTRLLHGSAPNQGSSPRTLFIAVYSADDAVPLSPNPMPHRFEGMLVAGQRSRRVRSVAFDMRLPQLPRTGSFFDQQAAPSR
ncbi:MAG: phytanoyl-CoA dioxygenase family protein [Burkholderiaceae bacterium]